VCILETTTPRIIIVGMLMRRTTSKIGQGSINWQNTGNLTAVIHNTAGHAVIREFFYILGKS
jgi:hypothetical protein